MSREIQVKVNCDRCKRSEFQDAPDPHAADAKSEPVLQLAMYDDPEYHTETRPLLVKFNDLCTPCKRTVRRLVEQIAKCIDGQSPARSGRKKTS